MVKIQYNTPQGRRWINSMYESMIKEIEIELVDPVDTLQRSELAPNKQHR